MPLSDSEAAEPSLTACDSLGLSIPGSPLLFDIVRRSSELVLANGRSGVYIRLSSSAAHASIRASHAGIREGGVF